MHWYYWLGIGLVALWASGIAFFRYMDKDAQFEVDRVHNKNRKYGEPG